MTNTQSFLELARIAYQLIDEETDRHRLVGLSSFVLALKPLLDGMGTSPDLGTELLEFVQLKRDGNPHCTAFGEEAIRLINRAEQGLVAS